MVAKLVFCLTIIVLGVLVEGARRSESGPQSAPRSSSRGLHRKNSSRSSSGSRSGSRGLSRSSSQRTSRSSGAQKYHYHPLCTDKRALEQMLQRKLLYFTNLNKTTKSVQDLKKELETIEASIYTKSQKQKSIEKQILQAKGGRGRKSVEDLKNELKNIKEKKDTKSKEYNQKQGELRRAKDCASMTKNIPSVIDRVKSWDNWCSEIIEALKKRTADARDNPLVSMEPAFDFFWSKLFTYADNTIENKESVKFNLSPMALAWQAALREHLGSPMQVYHGTKETNLQYLGQVGLNKAENSDIRYGDGIYTAEKFEVSSRFAKNWVLRCELYGSASAKDFLTSAANRLAWHDKEACGLLNDCKDLMKKALGKISPKNEMIYDKSIDSFFRTPDHPDGGGGRMTLHRDPYVIVYETLLLIPVEATCKKGKKPPLCEEDEDVVEDDEGDSSDEEEDE